MEALFRGIFEGLNGKQAKDGKVARTDANMANKIAAHLRAKWPELQHLPVWFSGSQVWSFLYGEEPPAGSDTDIFVLKDEPAIISYEGGFLSSIRVERPVIDQVFVNLGLTKEQVTPRTPANPMYQSNGFDVKTERGDIDVWTAEAKSVVEQLRMYPGGSHAHCRAAFSFRDGLVVLPNEAANV